MGIGKNYLAKCLNFLKQNKYSVLCFCFFFILALYSRLNFMGQYHFWSHPDVSGSLLFSILLAIISASVQLALLYILSQIRYVGIVLIAVMGLVLVLDASFVAHWGTIVTPGIIGSIFETNAAEASNMVQDYLLFGIPFLILTSFILFCAYRELRVKKRYFLRSSLVIVGGLVFSCISVMISIDKDNRVRLISDMNVSFVLTLQSYLYERLPLQFNSAVSIIAYTQEMVKFRMDLHKTKVLYPGIEYTLQEEDYQTLFVIIGESSNREHYSLYGYPILTTPFLDSLNAKELLMKWNGISPACATRDAIRLALTFSSPFNDLPQADNKNILAMANDAGYETYWISNQDKLGMHDSYIGMIASHAKHSEFFNYQKKDIDLSAIAEEYYQPQKKQMFFIHQRGSHSPYSLGYDEDDANYLVDLGNDQSIVDYDRTIYHNDRTIEQLYTQVKQKSEGSKALILYFSDHGEIVSRGHGLFEQDIQQFLVPFIIIPINDSLKKTENIAVKYQTKDLLNTNSTPFILSELMGYSVDTTNVIQARKDGEYYYSLDRKAMPIDDLK